MILLDTLKTEILNKIPFEARISVANSDENEIKVLALILRKYTIYRFEQFNEEGNEELLKEYQHVAHLA